MDRPRMAYRVHALQRMYERRISPEDVEKVVMEGDVIEAYPDDRPYPSRLILGFLNKRPLHVVVADNTADAEIVIITVYEPDPVKWEAGFRRRIRP